MRMAGPIWPVRRRKAIDQRRRSGRCRWLPVRFAQRVIERFLELEFAHQLRNLLIVGRADDAIVAHQREVISGNEIARDIGILL